MGSIMVMVSLQLSAYVLLTAVFLVNVLAQFSFSAPYNYKSMNNPCNIMYRQNYQVMCSIPRKRPFTHSLKAICNLLLYTYGFQRLYLEGTYCLKIIASNGDDKRKIGIIEFNSNNFCSILCVLFCGYCYHYTILSFAFEIAECSNNAVIIFRDKQPIPFDKTI